MGGLGQLTSAWLGQLTSAWLEGECGRAKSAHLCLFWRVRLAGSAHLCLDLRDDGSEGSAHLCLDWRRNVGGLGQLTSAWTGGGMWTGWVSSPLPGLEEECGLDGSAHLCLDWRRNVGGVTVPVLVGPA